MVVLFVTLSWFPGLCLTLSRTVLLHHDALISELLCVPPLQTGAEDSDYSYELFSVIIHKGGCYGGHYHVYIRDIDQLGHWEPPVRKREEQTSIFYKKKKKEVFFSCTHFLGYEMTNSL